MVPSFEVAMFIYHVEVDVAFYIYILTIVHNITNSISFSCARNIPHQSC